MSFGCGICALVLKRQDVIDGVVSIGEYVCVAGILVMLLFLDGIKWLDLVAGSSLLSVQRIGFKKMGLRDLGDFWVFSEWVVC